MKTRSYRKCRPADRRLTVVALTLIAVATSAVSLTSCSTDSGNDTTSSFSPRPTAPNTASFSGTPPSAMASHAASAKAAASARASSASAAASSFDASVSAETARANKAAAAALKKVDGRGNAQADVSITGKPVADTGGLRAVVVSITNRTDEKASYAVQVDFADSAGKVMDTRIVGAEDLDPGENVRPLAISRKPADLNLTPRLAVAQRY